MYGSTRLRGAVLVFIPREGEQNVWGELAAEGSSCDWDGVDLGEGEVLPYNAGGELLVPGELSSLHKDLHGAFKFGSFLGDSLEVPALATSGLHVLQCGVYLIISRHNFRSAHL